MALEYYEKLMNTARELDDGIAVLSSRWDMPSVLAFVKATEERTKELHAHILGLRDVLEDTENGLEELTLRRGNTVKEIYENAMAEYEVLRKECENLSTVFREYGYHKDIEEQIKGLSNRTLAQVIAGTQDLDLASDSEEEEEDEEAKEEEGEEGEEEDEPIPASDGSYQCEPNVMPITTPQGDSLKVESAESTEHTDSDGSFIAREDYIKKEDYKFTPGGSQRPPEPIYSKHYYDLLKK